MNRVTFADVMNRDFVGVSESDGIAAVARTMRDAGETAAVVLRGNDPVGIVTTAAVLDHFLAGDTVDDSVEQLMAPVPPSFRPEASVDEGTVALARTDAGALLVANGDGVQGLVLAEDLVTAFRQPNETAVAAAAEAAPDHEPTDHGGADSYSSQSICEACGGLARTLANVNGQLLCADCRGV